MLIWVVYVNNNALYKALFEKKKKSKIKKKCDSLHFCFWMFKNQ